MVLRTRAGMEVLTTMDLVGLAGVEVLEVITGTGTETEDVEMVVRTTTQEITSMYLGCPPRSTTVNLKLCSPKLAELRKLKLFMIHTPASRGVLASSPWRLLKKRTPPLPLSTTLNCTGRPSQLERLGGVGLVLRPLENTSGPPNAALLVTVPTTLGRTTRGILETGTVIMTDATEETVLDDMMIPDGIEIMINPEIEIEAVTEEEVTGEEVIEEGETATATMTVEIERKAGSEGATKYGVNSPLFFSSHKWFNLDGCMNELLFSLLISTI